MTTAVDAAIAEPLPQRRQLLRDARLAFRHWRRSRPFWAGVWTMLGGALIAYVPGTAFKLVLIANASLIIGILVGAIIGFFGLMLWFARPLRVLLGVLIILLSLVSFLTSDFGGLILGMLMGLLGGSLALAWVPVKVTWRERRRARKLAGAGEPVTEVGVPATEAGVPATEAGVPEKAPATAAVSTRDGGEEDAVTDTRPDLTDELLGDGATETSPAPETVHLAAASHSPRPGNGAHSRDS